MEYKYCWRCKMEVPMLNKEEYSKANELYKAGFRILDENSEERFKELLTFYFELTGFKETEPNAIMHHSLDLIGSDCENCGKPYRTPKARLCAACGNKRNKLEDE